MLYESAFSEAPIREYLEAFYAPQGGVEFGWLKGADFTLIECPRCGLIYQRHVGADELLARLYEHWIDPAKVFALIDGRQNAEYFLRLARQIANVVDYFGMVPRELKCLDFGMGWGHWCRVARAFGCETFGAELSRARISAAAAGGIPVLSYAEIAGHQFDLINTEQVFEHLPDPHGTLVHLSQALKPGGLIRISVPDGWNVKPRLAKGDWMAPKGSRLSLNAVAPLEHVNCFNHQALVRLGARAGLKPALVPERYAISLGDWFRSRVKPWYFRLRGMGDAAIYFRRE